MNNLSLFTAFIILLMGCGHTVSAQTTDQNLHDKIERIEIRMPVLERQLVKDKKNMDETKQHMEDTGADSFYLHAKEKYFDAKKNIAEKKVELALYKKQEIASLNDRLDSVFKSLAGMGVSATNSTRPNDAGQLEQLLAARLEDLTEAERKYDEVVRLAKLKQLKIEEKQRLESLRASANKDASIKVVASNEVAIIKEERMSNDWIATIQRYLGMLLFLFVVFSVVYSLVKGIGRTAVVFADYTDLTLTFSSIIGLPLVIIIASLIATDEIGTMSVVLIMIQFLVIQCISARNLYYLNGGDALTTIFVAVGRMVLCIVLIATIADLFKKGRSSYSQVLTFIFSILLGKLILLVVARNEFTPLDRFFNKAEFVDEYDDEFIAGYRQIGTVS